MTRPAPNGNGEMEMEVGPCYVSRIERNGSEIRGDIGPIMTFLAPKRPFKKDSHGSKMKAPYSRSSQGEPFFAATLLTPKMVV